MSSNLVIRNTDLVHSGTPQKIETDIFNYRSKELFINLDKKDIPPKGSEHRKDFIFHEIEKCWSGVKINGIFIPGSYYWDFNHFCIPLERKDHRGVTYTTAYRPHIRDNDWEIHEAFNECENQFPKQNLIIGAARQISKTKNMGSIFARDLCLIDGCKNVFLVGNEPDIAPFTEVVYYGIDNCSEFFRLPRLTKSKDASTIEWGIKSREGDNIVKSTMYIRNANKGQNTQVSAGLFSINRAVLDEVGKYPFRSSYETLVPALRGDDGFRSSNLLSFTGGDSELSLNAEELFMNPFPSHFREFDCENKKVGKFIGGWYRRDGKKDIKFTEWDKFKDKNIPKSSELHSLNMKVVDWEKVNSLLKIEEEAARKSKDPSALIQFKMYYPQKIEDMFLSPNKNPFTEFFEPLRQHKEFLLDTVPGTPVELYRGNSGKIEYTLSTQKNVINTYPVQKNVDTDAPIVIYDFPKYEQNYKLHIIDCDAYNDSETLTSDSLGAIYVLRRPHSDLEDPYRGVMVASYCARPKKISEWLKNLEYLQEFYNAEVNFERSGNPVKHHFESKNKFHVFMQTLSLQRQVNPKTKVQSEVGWNANEANHRFQIEQTYRYLSEELDNGTLGLTRILDPVLIDEIIAYNGTGKNTNNVDRFDAFSMLCVHYYSYEKYDNFATIYTNTTPQPVQRKQYEDAFNMSHKAIETKWGGHSAFGF